MSKTVKNYIYNLAYQVLLILVPLITIPYLSRVLGSDGVGLHGYSNSIVVYFSLFGCLGINLFGQREVAYRKDDIEERSKCFWELIIVRTLSSLFCSLLYLAFILLFVRDGALETQLLIQTIIILANAIDISWFYQGLEEFKKTATRSIAVKIVTVCLIFLFVHQKDDLWKYTLILSCSTLFGNVFLWASIKKRLVRVDFRLLRFSRHLGPILLLFLPQIASSVHTVLDKTMIGAMTDNDQVAYYEQSQKVSNLLLVICTSLNTVLMPKIAYLKEKQQQAKILNYLSIASQFILLISIPMAVGVFFVADDFVPAFFGPGYSGAIPILKIMSVLTIIVGLSNAFGVQYLVPVGDQKSFNVSIFLGTSINVCLNLVLIMLFKSIGATIATIVSEIVITAYQYSVIKRHNRSFSIGKQCCKYLLLGLVLFLALAFEKTFLNPGVSRMMIMVGTGVPLYIALLLGTKDKIMYSVIHRVKTKLQEKRKN